MEGVRQVAPVSNAEGGGRLMLSKGIDAECGVLKLCVCVCVESFRTLGACQCATKVLGRNGRAAEPVPPHERLV